MATRFHGLHDFETPEVTQVSSDFAAFEPFGTAQVGAEAWKRSDISAGLFALVAGTSRHDGDDLAT